MSTTPFFRTLTVADTGSVSTAYQLGKDAANKAVMPTSILCPANLRGVDRVKVQVSQDDVTYYDIHFGTAVVPLALTVDVVLPVPAAVQQATVGWAFMRLVTLDATNVAETPTAGIAFVVRFAEGGDAVNQVPENEAVGVVTAVAIDQTSPGATNAVTLVSSGDAGDAIKAEDAAHSSGDAGVHVLTVRRDTAVAGAGTDADYQSLITNSTGHLHVVEGFSPGYEDNTNNVAATLQKPVAASAYAPSNYIDFGTVTKANIKATPGNVYSVACYNENAAVRYFQLHNKATAPAAGETPVFSYPVPAGSANNPGSIQFDSTWFGPSHYFATGIGWAISTTEATFTDSATAAEHGARVRYV